jgi:hypothetical protein
MQKIGKYWICLTTVLLLQASTGCLFGQFYSLTSGKDGISSVHFSMKKDWILYRSENKLKPGDLASIESVWLNNHKLSAEELKHVCGFPSLLFLAIGHGPEGVKLNGVNLGDLPRMHGLEALNLCIEGIKDEDLEILRKCPNLKHLSVESVYSDRGVLTDDWSESLLTLNNLETLEIGNWPLTDQFIESVSKLKKLRKLTICSDKVTNLGVRIIAEKTGIKKLTIRSGTLTRQDIGVLLATERFDNLNLEFRGGELTFAREKMNVKANNSTRGANGN